MTSHDDPEMSSPKDVIFCADARRMAEVPDECAQLVVTSPPYNVGISYDNHNDDLPLDDYLTFLNQVWRECYRVLTPGGRLCINVANTNRKPYLPLNALITAEILRMARTEDLHWCMRGEIIWDKAASAGISTAWGSFASSTNPVLRDMHEYIMVFSKDQFKLPDGGKTGITGGQFVDWTRSIWRPEASPDDKSPYSLADLERRLRDKLKDARHRDKDDAWIAESMARAAWQYVSQPGESIWPMTTESGVDHPAPFPIELPKRLILIYTSPDDLVLDPFMGAGATAVAAVRTGRHFVGYDISEEYCALAQKRVAEGRLVDW